jgi:YtxH-like protein
MSLRRQRNLLTSALLGAGLYALDSVRDLLSEKGSRFSDRARDGYDDLRSRASDFYSTAYERFDRANDAMMGRDHHFMRSATAALIGVGVGVGLGMLLAPTSGEETRQNIKERVRDRWDRVAATGTTGA